MNPSNSGSSYTSTDMNVLYGTRPASGTAQTISCPNGYISYTLSDGDTLYEIARNRGITVNELLFYNPTLNPYCYNAGQSICVPESSGGQTPDNNTPVPLPEPPASDTESAAVECSGTLYTVVAGDTLRLIAQKNEITPEALLAANPELNRTRLTIGQQLCIPSATDTAPCNGMTRIEVTSTDFVEYLVEYNISYAALSDANPNLDLSLLNPGQTLCIPASGSRGTCSGGTGTLILEQSYTPTALAAALNVTIQDLMRLNPTYTPTDFAAGRILCVPPTRS